MDISLLFHDIILLMSILLSENRPTMFSITNTWCCFCIPVCSFLCTSAPLVPNANFCQRRVFLYPGPGILPARKSKQTCNGHLPLWCPHASSTRCFDYGRLGAVNFHVDTHPKITSTATTWTQLGPSLMSCDDTVSQLTHTHTHTRFAATTVTHCDVSFWPPCTFIFLFHSPDSASCVPPLPSNPEVRVSWISSCCALLVCTTIVRRQIFFYDDLSEI
jgi:hypothetical protein